jgi:hypothetical protein
MASDFSTTVILKMYIKKIAPCNELEVIIDFN